MIPDNWQRRWTAKEDQRLLAAAISGVDTLLLAERFRRTPGGIRWRVRLLKQRHGLSRPQWSCRDFSDEEDDLLREGYRRFPASQLGRMTGRSRNSIIGRLNRLGLLTKTRRNPPVTAAIPSRNDHAGARL